MSDSSSSVQARREEILAKRAKLAELKKQRELREKQISAARQSIGGDGSEVVSPIPSRLDNRKEIESLVSSVLGDSRPTSTGPPSISASPARRSRPTSVTGVSQLSHISGDRATDGTPPQPVRVTSQPPQTLTIAPSITVYEAPSDPEPKPEYVTYSKAVQTVDIWTSPQDQGVGADAPDDDDWESPSRARANKRLSRRERDREEELRERIRSELEQERQAAQTNGGPVQEANGVGTQTANFPLRPLTDEELNAVTGSDEFLGFIDRSTKVIERALEDQYDILMDYADRARHEVDEEDGYGASRSKKGRRVKEIAQFGDERWTYRRMITDLSFSPKFPEIVLASYSKSPSHPNDPHGLVQLWNLHMQSRPETTCHANSDILCAKFSPFHPSIIVGGTYAGQILLWDTRQKTHTPQQQTPLTGAGAGHGHSHPVYSIDIVGTQNANNIISCSTDGVVCGWSVDMLTQPAEYLELSVPAALSKIEDVAPTCIAFPNTDPTYFLAGTEEGTIYSCHRYDRAGAKAGVDARIAYRGHAAPVMDLDFHPARGAVDLGDLVLSSSVDWSVRLWRVRPPAAAVTALNNATPSSSAGLSSTTAAAGITATSAAAPPTAGQNASISGGGSSVGNNHNNAVGPLLEITREDLVYSARWSPTRPSIFALVDGAGSLEVWDVNLDVEVPVARVAPSTAWVEKHIGGREAELGAGGLNKVAWEPNEGKRLATGGRDGVVTVFEVGGLLGGNEGAKLEEWSGVKKRVGAWERGVGGNVFVNGR